MSLRIPFFGGLEFWWGVPGPEKQFFHSETLREVVATSTLAVNSTPLKSARRNEKVRYIALFKAGLSAATS